MIKAFKLDNDIPYESGKPVTVPDSVTTGGSSAGGALEEAISGAEPDVISFWENLQLQLSGVSPLMWLLLALLLIVVLLVIVLLVKRSRANKPPKEEFVIPKGVEIGKVHEIGARSSQQDSFAVSPDSLQDSRGILAVVADGMGGLADGDQVSQMVAGTMIEEFCKAKEDGELLLYRLLQKANRNVNELLGGRSQRSGSTVVAGLLKNHQFHYISVGDSRICLYRNGQLLQLNREHIYQNELLQKAINQNDDLMNALQAEKGGSLTSYLGMGQLKYVDIPAAPLNVQPGDKLILMSDGIYNFLPESELSLCLALPVQEAAEQIRSRITEKGYTNQDNYTAVILSC